MAKIQNILIIIHFATEFLYFCRAKKENNMDANKLTLHHATMAKNLPGAAKCINSVFSAIVLNISTPFTRDDLHQLYDYDKALYKAAIEKTMAQYNLQCYCI